MSEKRSEGSRTDDLLNYVIDHDRVDRSLTQMTLGRLIARLKSIVSPTVEAFGRPHSYRGYYRDLAFERRPGRMTTHAAILVCEACLDKTFEGYKGGDFTMNSGAPVWFAEWGRSDGHRVISLNNNGTFETETEGI